MGRSGEKAVLSLLAAAGAMIALVPALAEDGPALRVLSRLQSGLWQLRDLDNRGASPKAICLASPETFLQLQHRQLQCSRRVIENKPDGLTVNYSCGSQGFGRTAIRVETSRLAQIDTQGVVGGVPFAHRYEARRIGACGMARN